MTEWNNGVYGEPESTLYVVKPALNSAFTPEGQLITSLEFRVVGSVQIFIDVLTTNYLNNLLGLADQWFVSGARSSDFANDHNARSVQAGVSLPYGYWLANYNYSYSDYLSTIDNQGFDWQSSGDSQTHRFNLSRVLFRNSEMKTGLALGLTHRINRNCLNDARLESSRRKLTSVSLGTTHSQKLWGGFATLNPTYSRGVPWLGVEDDSGKSDDAPRAESNKVSLSSSYYLPLSQDWTYLTSVYGQWSPDRLYGSERLNIGGESSVRGCGAIPVRGYRRLLA